MSKVDAAADDLWLLGVGRRVTRQLFLGLVLLAAVFLGHGGLFFVACLVTLEG